MPETDNDEERDASPTGKTTSKPTLPEPKFGYIGEMFKGLATMTREFEQCPRGSKVTERLIFGGMACLVLVTYIRYSH